MLPLSGAALPLWALRTQHTFQPGAALQALLAGAFVLGIGVGTWFNSEVSLAPSNVASTELIDRKTPNTEVCMANGFSSMVFDQRLFVSFNPCAPGNAASAAPGCAQLQA